MYDAASLEPRRSARRAAARRGSSSRAGDRARPSLARLGQRSPVRAILLRARPAPTRSQCCSTRRAASAAAIASRSSASSGPGARATLVGQAAEKRLPARSTAPRRSSRGSRSARAAVAPLGAAGDAALRRRDARAPDRAPHRRKAARLLAAETLVFGRRAMGELVRAAPPCATTGGSSAAAGWSGRTRCVLVGTTPCRALDAASGFAGHEALCTLVFAGERARGGARGDARRARRRRRSPAERAS